MWLSSAGWITAFLLDISIQYLLIHCIFLQIQIYETINATGQTIYNKNNDVK